MADGSGWAYWSDRHRASVLGVLLVVPIGGADMPVVIALLNSYSGLAAAAAGFVISNNVLIIAGSLVGASGMILTQHHVQGDESLARQRAVRQDGSVERRPHRPTKSTAAR